MDPKIENIAILLSELMMRHTALEKTLIDTGKLDIVLFEQNLMEISLDVLKRMNNQKILEDKEIQ